MLYWCSGAGSFNDGGLGQINKPIGALDDCKGHTSLGSGWDISLSPTGANVGFTITGANGGSNLMNGTFGGPLVGYGSAGRAQALWVRLENARSVHSSRSSYFSMTSSSWAASAYHARISGFSRTMSA